MIRSRPFLYTLGYVLISLSFRLYFSQSLNFTTTTIMHWFAALAIGVVNDLIAVGFILAILQVLSSLKPMKVKIHALSCTMVILGLIILIQLIADTFFWFEFQNRGNRLILHYLQFPWEVISFLQEQLYLWYWVIPLIVVIVVFYKRLVRYLTPLIQNFRTQLWKSIVSITYIILGFIAVGQWNMLEPFQSRLLNQFSGNGIVNLIHTVQIDITQWSTGYPTLTASQIDQLTTTKVSNNRAVEAFAKDKHIIVIVEESFAGKYWSDPKLRLENMPNLMRWAKQGILFDNIYATGTRTTRGLDAIFHGAVPLPGIAINQRPIINLLPSLPSALKQDGYDTWFIYGGWPNFSNFSNYWSSIGFDNIQTKENFDASLFQTSWGVADEFLFERILQVMDNESQKGRPLFLSSLTVSNHRPFDVPKDRLEYSEHRTLKNGIHYADFALGEFLDKASVKPWFKDSLIVVVADHGPGIYGEASIPVNSFHVPLLLIAPELATVAHSPSIHENLGSISDLPKTLLKLVSSTQSQQFNGNDLLVTDNQRYALVEHEYHLGILQPNQQLSVLPYRGKPETWQFENIQQTSKAKPIAVDSDAISLLNAIMQQSHNSLYPSP